MMVYKGDADGMVSGATCTTQHTILPALQFIKTKPDNCIVSVFFMCLEDRVSVLVIVPSNPTAGTISGDCDFFSRFEFGFWYRTKKAMLSYSSGASGKDEVEK
jgi:phosphate acetyltransferase